MHPHLMTTVANEHAYELRAFAARERRGRFAVTRSRRAAARRARVLARLHVAHA